MSLCRGSIGDDSGLKESGEGRNGQSSLLQYTREVKDDDLDYQPASKRKKLDLSLSLAPTLDEDPAGTPYSSSSSSSKAHDISKSTWISFLYCFQGVRWKGVRDMGQSDRFLV
jgi:hypothetical protein